MFSNKHRVNRLLLVFVGAFLCFLFLRKSNDTKNNFKYILQWGSGPDNSPFYIMGVGQSKFIEHKCKFDNCYVTNKKWFLRSLTSFDAVIFSGNILPQRTNLPYERSLTQKYIFVGTESAHNYRVCDSVYDGYFNWTWTYRLDSDARWGYLAIEDLSGNVVGPKKEMLWSQLEPISESLKQSLSTKKKMAAWFVSNCETYSKREQFVAEMQRELKRKKYNWTIDVFGRCGDFSCPRNQQRECDKILKRDYYFYFSFENSFAEDYVTEKLLTALHNNAVPVVYGSANYSRFLPPGSYLNARELGVVKLAETMDAIYKNKTAYYDFFRWQNHYRYKDTIESDICNLCAALNDEDAVKKTTVYKDFRKWWNDEQWDGSDQNC